MYKTVKKIEEGFTIVEVLIVLAIAALILAIVLIAVPDLQRSARNTDIIHDAQNVASAIQTYEGNNSGDIPTPATANAQTVSNSGVIAIGLGSGGASAQAHIQASDIVFWESGVAKVTWDSAGSGATSSTVGVGGIFIDNGEDCGTFTAGTSAPGSYSLTADQRAVAVLYPIEGTSADGSSIGCIQE